VPPAGKVNRFETRGKLEIGNWKLETGNRELETGK
jgi:hypothetical protein